MIRTLVFGAIAGIVGKKLYDQGKLDPYIEEAKTWLNAKAAGGDAGDTAGGYDAGTGPAGPKVSPVP